MRRTALLLVVLMVIGSACGSDDDASPPTTPAPPDPAGDETPLVDLEDGQLDLASPAWSEGASIPVEHTCDGDGTSPPLAWGGVPDAAAELTLVVEDPDAPAGHFLHWRVEGIDPASEGVARGEVPAGGRETDNDAGGSGWAPPCPPRDDEPHRYLFRLTALSATGEELARGELVGRYGR